MLDETKPLYIAVAEQIEDGILDGTHPEDSPVPSSNELAAFLRINPATAGKGLNLLADAGVLVNGAEWACSWPPAPSRGCDSAGATTSPVPTSSRCCAKPPTWASNPENSPR